MILYKGMMNDDNEMCMMNVDANLDDLKYYVGTSYILESWNPPIPSRHVSSLIVSNFDAYRHILKKFQLWPHSLLAMRGRCIAIVVGELKVPWNFKRIPTKILQMAMKNDDNETSIMNVDANMDDLKYYMGTSDILESWNPSIPSRHVSSITMSNFDAYKHSLKKFQRWPHSILTMWSRWKMTFVMGVLEVPWHFKRVATKVLCMEMMNDDNETSIIFNVDEKMDDIKYYVGT